MPILSTEKRRTRYGGKIYCSESKSLPPPSIMVATGLQSQRSEGIGEVFTDGNYAKQTSRGKRVRQVRGTSTSSSSRLLLMGHRKVINLIFKWVPPFVDPLFRLDVAQTVTSRCCPRDHEAFRRPFFPSPLAVGESVPDVTWLPSFGGHLEDVAFNPLVPAPGKHPKKWMGAYVYAKSSRNANFESFALFRPG